MISLSFITPVPTSGIYTEVFNHHSTQFSEAKTTYASKQLLEQQYRLQLGHLKGHSVLSASFSPRQRQGDTSNRGYCCIVSGVIH